MNGSAIRAFGWAVSVLMWLGGCAGNTITHSRVSLASSEGQWPVPDATGSPSSAGRSRTRMEPEPPQSETSHSSSVAESDRATDQLAKPSTQPAAPASAPADAQYQSTAELLKTLQAAYARLILERGDTAERQMLKKALEEENVPAALEFVIGWHLSHNEFEAARYWISLAQARGQHLPAWQRLALALEEEDLETVERLLKEPNSDLTPAHRVQALRYLGLDSQALAEARSAIETTHKGADSEDLYRQIEALTVKLAHRAVLTPEFRTLGPLDITMVSALLNLRLGNTSRIHVGVGANRLSSDPKELDVHGFDSERAVSLGAERTYRLGKISGQIGANIRDDHSLFQGKVSWFHRFGKGWLAQMEYANNEISEESPALRATGAKDRLSLGLFMNPTPWEFARTQLNLQHYHTRDGDRLANGYAVQAELGRFLLKEHPTWQVRLQGSWESNSLVKRLPAELNQILTPGANVETVVPRDFGTLGIGSGLYYHVPTEERIPKYFGLMDAWLGWVWPAKELGYNVRLGLGISPGEKALLSFNGFYSNTQGGRTEESYRGVQIQYTLLF
jgi:polysaccharide biosynthesis protein PelB